MGYRGQRRARADDHRGDHRAQAGVPLRRAADPRHQRAQPAAPLPREAGVAHLHRQDRLRDRQGDRRRACRSTCAPTRANEPRHAYLVQDNVYDLVFLMERARANGYDLVVEEPPGSPRRLYFGPSTQIRRASYRLVYGGSLVEFQPNLTTANQVGEVVVRGWDPIKQGEDRVPRDARRAGHRRASGPVSPRACRSPSRTARRSSPPRSSRARPRRGGSRSRPSSRSPRAWSPRPARRWACRTLRAGSVIEVGGLGERFSGRYFVTDTTHAIGDSGYTTQFGCRREEVKGS